jgi:hypothetical protein
MDVWLRGGCQDSFQLVTQLFPLTEYTEWTLNCPWILILVTYYYIICYIILIFNEAMDSNHTCEYYYSAPARILPHSFLERGREFSISAYLLAWSTSGWVSLNERLVWFIPYSFKSFYFSYVIIISHFKIIFNFLLG